MGTASRTCSAPPATGTILRRFALEALFGEQRAARGGDDSTEAPDTTGAPPWGQPVWGVRQGPCRPKAEAEPVDCCAAPESSIVVGDEPAGKRNRQAAAG